MEQRVCSIFIGHMTYKDETVFRNVDTKLPMKKEQRVFRNVGTKLPMKKEQIEFFETS